jgi:transglutaminase-like putative cysteine protease
MLPTKAKQEAIRKYRKISKQLADPKLHSELRKLFEKTYTLQELLDWLHTKLHWNKGKIPRHTTPLAILKHGQGRCGEYSILFTALCLAHGYRARIVIDLTDHVWTEVWNKEQNKWTHVDPSEKRIDDPKMYERDWKKNLQGVYAFENGKMKDVTKTYKLNTQTKKGKK